MKSKGKYISQLTEDDFRAMMERIIESDISGYKFELQRDFEGEPSVNGTLYAKNPDLEFTDYFSRIFDIVFYGDFKFDVSFLDTLNISSLKMRDGVDGEREVLKYMIETFGEEYAEDFLKYFVTNITTKAKEASDAMNEFYMILGWTNVDASELDDITLGEIFEKHHSDFYGKGKIIKDSWIEKQREEETTIDDEIEMMRQKLIDRGRREVAAVKKLVNDIVEEVRIKKTGHGC